MQTRRSRRRTKREDRISALPDLSLVNIISRLPSTKEAIRTGILSKQWKNLWTEVHNLIFIHHSGKRIPELFSYIEKVLRQRVQLDLNKFQLDIPYDDGFDKQVNGLIRYAFSCNVKDLDLMLVSADVYRAEFVLDQFFFINSSITHMKLTGCIIKPTGTISWTNLKSLCLCLVWEDLDENLIEKILSGSPLLETLKLKDCAYRGFLRIDITSKSVKNLVLAGYQDRSEWIDEVEINAPHILSLTIEGEMGMYLLKVVLLNVSSLVEAVLDYCLYEDGDEEEAEEMLKGLILSLRHVKRLHIGYNCLKTLYRLEAKGFPFPIGLTACDITETEDSCDITETED